MKLSKERLVNIIIMIDETIHNGSDKIETAISKLDGSDITTYFESFYEGHTLKNKAKLQLKKFIDDYGYDNVVEGIDIAVLQYDYHDTTKENFEDAFCKLGGILYNKFGRTTLSN